LRYTYEEIEDGKGTVTDNLFGGVYEFDTVDEAKEQTEALNCEHEQTAKEYDRQTRVTEPDND
jgi:hypothetical protein